MAGRLILLFMRLPSLTPCCKFLEAQWTLIERHILGKTWSQVHCMVPVHLACITILLKMEPKQMSGETSQTLARLGRQVCRSVYRRHAMRLLQGFCQN